MDSAGEIKFKRGVLWFGFGPGSFLGKHDEDQVERPRSRSVKRNPCRFYSRKCRP